MKHWLMKSEPDVYGIDHLLAEPQSTDHWDGIRNYQARNFMRDGMRVGDHAFFYHSSCAEPGIVGTMIIVRNAYPDPTQFDPGAKYYDAKSDPDDPRWLMVDVRFERKFEQALTLRMLRAQSRLKNMRLLQRGNRLSIMPVTRGEWNYILKLSETR